MNLYATILYGYGTSTGVMKAWESRDRSVHNRIHANLRVRGYKLMGEAVDYKEYADGHGNKLMVGTNGSWQHVNKDNDVVAEGRGVPELNAHLGWGQPSGYSFA